MKLEFKQISLGDIRLAYVDRGIGTPVVLVHGGGPTDLRTWEHQIEPFARHYRVIAYSQRYHYPNAWIGDGSDVNSTFVHTEDLAGLITALQLEPVHLVGNSFGADIVLRFALQYPDLVRTLVLEEPGLVTWLFTLPGGTELASEFEKNIIPVKQAALEGDLERGMELFINAVMGKGLFEEFPPSLRDRLMDNARLLGFEPTDLTNDVIDITRSQAATIQAPTLILTGDRSPEMFLKVSQELARFMPNAEQAQVARASHVLHSMNPGVFNAAVMKFFGKYAG